MESSRRPKNKAEGECFDVLRADGWNVTKRGYPDFFCWKETPEGEMFAFIEVKPKRSNRLKTMQLKVMKFLSSKGIECYRWSPDYGFTRIEQDSGRI